MFSENADRLTRNVYKVIDHYNGIMQESNY